VDVAVPRNTPDGKTTEWKSRTLRTYQRHTLAANAPIAGCFSPPPTRSRARRPVAGAVGKDTVSRVWRK